MVTVLDVGEGDEGDRLVWHKFQVSDLCGWVAVDQKGKTWGLTDLRENQFRICSL